MVFLTLIPVRRNDGSPIGQAELDALLERIWTTFGGATIDGPVRGVWKDAATGTVYRDESLRVSVASESGRIAEAMELVRAIGRQLGQLEMPFEVRDFGMAFLKC